jgi:beta-glucanase (GH16 family)
MTKLLVFVFAAAIAYPFGVLASPPDLSTMVMTFDDEFSWSRLTTTNWVTNFTSTTPINNEEQAYTPDAVVSDQANGVLRLRADQRNWNGWSYTSGAITSFAHFQQTYGYFIMRARLPKGQGIWPAFWMIPSSGSWPPEIDIMENLGSDPNTIYMTNHLSNGSKSQSSFTGPDFSASYHTFALLWTPTALTWFVDGVTRRTYTGPAIPNVPMYILANVAIGGTWPGSPNSSTVFPQSMDIDYIRAYQFNPAPAGVVPNAITLSGIWVSPMVVKAGDSVKLSSQATVGPNALSSGGVYEIGVCAYSGNPCYAFQVFPLSQLAAGSTIGFSYWYSVPSSGLPDGWYNVNTTVLTSGGSSTSQAADQFTVRNNATPFIVSLPPLRPALKP